MSAPVVFHANFAVEKEWYKVVIRSVRCPSVVKHHRYRTLEGKDSPYPDELQRLCEVREPDGQRLRSRRSGNSRRRHLFVLFLFFSFFSSTMIFREVVSGRGARE